MGIFRRSHAEPLAVTMAGIKLGDRLLSLGARDPKLVAALATKAGLTGRACVVEVDQARVPAVAAAIEREGALVEVAHAPGYALPFEAAGFDVAVARDMFAGMPAADTTRLASEALRVLRGGGRLLVLESTRRIRIDPQALTATLTTAGFAAVRVLAEADHTLFVEGIKKA